MVLNCNITFYPNEFLDEYPQLQLKNIYSLFRHGQYNAKFADTELDLYYHWIKEKDEEITALYSEIKAAIAPYLAPESSGMYSV